MHGILAQALLILVVGICALLFSIPSLQCARRLLRHQAQQQPLPIQRHEKYALLIAPISGYLLLGMFATEMELLDWKHILSVLTFSGLSIGLYFVARTSKATVGPLLLALIPSALVVGVLLFIVEFVHFYIIIGLGVTMLISPLFFLALLIAPAFSLVQAAILLSTELYLTLNFTKQKVLATASSPLGRKLQAFYFGKYYLLAQLLTLPLFLTVVQVVLLVAAQRPDSLLQAFLESQEGLFAQGQCDNCVSHSTPEYICTIAGFGSPQLVKPLYWGHRHGQPIRVTRQLQVCNAFEEWLAATMPSIQRYLRNWYDSLQIAIEKWRQVQLVANTLYLLLKPLEWTFLLVLYLFVRNPETSIARQYLPADWKQTC